MKKKRFVNNTPYRYLYRYIDLVFFLERPPVGYVLFMHPSLRHTPKQPPAVLAGPVGLGCKCGEQLNFAKIKVVESSRCCAGVS